MAGNIIVQFSETEFRGLLKTCLKESFADLQKDVEQADPDKLLNIDEAAQYLSLAKQTLYGFTSRGVIPHLKRGKRLYFKKTTLLKWVNQGNIIGQ